MFVSFWNQGHWYYPVSICIANILVAVYLLRTKGILAFDFILRMALHHRIVRFISVAAVLAVSLLLLIYVAKFAVGHSASSVIGNYSLIRIAVMLGALGAATGLLLAAASILRSRITEVRVPVGFGISILLVLYVANAMMAEKADARYNQQYYRFWLRRKSTTSDIREQLNGKGILSFDDGIVAYSLGLPVMSGLGFTLDHPAVLAKQAHKLLEVAYERGFRCLTSVNYMPPLPATVGEDVTEDIRKVFWLSGENIDKWTFKLAYVQPETGHRFVQFEPRTNYTPTESILQNDPCDGRAF